MGTFAQGNNVIGAGGELVRAMAGRERGREAYSYYMFFVLWRREATKNDSSFLQA